LSPKKPDDEVQITISRESSVEKMNTIEDVRAKVKDFKSNVILLKLGEKHTGAGKARDVAEAERQWRQDNKHKELVEKNKAI